MDYNENQTPATEDTNSESHSQAEVSVTRRIITAVLVLVAALLLGYVLYDALLSHPKETTEPATPETQKEYTETEKRAILEAMQSEETELTVEEEQQRRAQLETMNTESSDDTTPEERAVILKAMNENN